MRHKGLMILIPLTHLLRMLFLPSFVASSIAKMINHILKKNYSLFKTHNFLNRKQLKKNLMYCFFKRNCALDNFSYYL